VGTELEEYFGHMARTSQRIVLRDALLSLDLAEGVTCFDAFACRPQERHLGRFDHLDQQPIVKHQMGSLRYGTPYILLYELRPWKAQSAIADLTLQATSALGPVRMVRQLRPSFTATSGALNDFVHKMADSVGTLVRSDTDTQISALEARITLYKREGRAPQHIEALERQLEIFRRGGNPSELSENDRRFVRAHVATGTERYNPI
jgi:hypothetical protein